MKFPESLSDDSIKGLNVALASMGKVTGEDAGAEAETVHLEKFEESHKNTHAQGGTRGDSDEEEGDSDEEGQGQRVGCQAQ